MWKDVLLQFFYVFLWFAVDIWQKASIWFVLKDDCGGKYEDFNFKLSFKLTIAFVAIFDFNGSNNCICNSNYKVCNTCSD